MKRAHGPTGRHQLRKLEIRVRLPVGPLQQQWSSLHDNSSSWSSPECSPACHAGDRGFKSHRGRWKTARYANRQSGEAQTFVNVCGFDSHPCYSRTITCVGWALASPAGCKPVVPRDSGGSIPSRRTLEQTTPRRGAMLVLQRGFQSRPRALRFPSESLKNAAKWWNLGRHATLRTSCPLRAWEFESPLGYWTERLQVGWCPVGFHKPDPSGSIPEPATDI